MLQISVALSLMVASQLVLIMLLLAISDNSLRVRLVGCLLMFGIFLYQILPLVDDYYFVETHAMFWLLSSITPSTLLLFVWFVFEEHECRLPLWMTTLIVLSVASSVVFAIFNQGLPEAPLWLQLLKVSVVGVALYVVLHGQDSDLVEQRFKARRLFVGALAASMLVTLSLEFVLDFDAPVKLDLIQNSVIFVLVTAINLAILKMNPQLEITSTPAAVVEQSEDPVIAELLQKMRDERLYADHDLRVASLAEIMQIPEYQLRRKINRQLGYRNFNQFVNHYRIEEASIKLRENPRLPVLSIALEAGFRSISSFNTAFQNQFGMSATRYRSAGQQA